MNKEISKNDMDIISKLETGDILLFNSSDHWYDWVVKKCTFSHYSHSAMVIRDPQYTKKRKNLFQKKLKERNLQFGVKNL